VLPKCQEETNIKNVLREATFVAHQFGKGYIHLKFNVRTNLKNENKRVTLLLLREHGSVAVVFLYVKRVVKWS